MMDFAVKFATDLRATDRLHELPPEALRDYFGRLAALLADPAAAGNDEALWAVVMECKRLGDRTGQVQLAAWLADHGATPEVRLRAAIQAGWGLVEIGELQPAREILERAQQALPPELAGGLPLITGILAIAAHQAGDFSAAESLSHLSINQINALDDDALAAATRQPRSRLLHARLNNLADFALERARTESGERRERTITLALQRITGGLSSRDCPPEVRAMYLSNYGVALRERGTLTEALAHFNELIGEMQLQPAHAFVLPTALRDRALTRRRLGDTAGAVEDLHLALHESLRNVAALEERAVIDQLVSALTEVYGGREAPEAELLDDFHVEARGIIPQLYSFMREKDWQAAAGIPARVAKRALNLYRQLDGKLPGAGNLSLEVLEAGAWLHDIGKLRLPWTLLNKTGPLTPWETTLMRTHAPMGETILGALGYRRVAAVAGGHHRFHEGGGYPDAEPQHDPQAALIAVADAYEVMIAQHPLAPPAKTPAEAVAELRRFTPRQFHPAVVEALAAGV